MRVLQNVPSVKNPQFVNWQMGHFSVASGTFFYIFWFNLINIPTFLIYYTYIYSNIHNLPEKEPKTPEKPIVKTQFKTQIETEI